MRNCQRSLKLVAFVACLAAGVALFAACSSSGRSAPTPDAKLSTLQTELAVGTADATTQAQYGVPLVKTAKTTDGRSVLAWAASGMTLYVFDEDVPAAGTSKCEGGCAATWPPAAIAFGTEFQVAGLGLFGQFLRNDGQRQLTYRGRPLYFYSGDKQAGDANGQGKDGHWSVAAP